MTEAEWLAARDPTPMLQFLANRTSERKLRLFVCACCRLVAHLLPEGDFRHAIEIAEQYSDGRAWGPEVDTVWNAVGAWVEEYDGFGPIIMERSTTQAVYAIRNALRLPEGRQKYVAHAIRAAAYASRAAQPGDLRATQIGLLRDIFGNPFRPVTFLAEWRTGTARALARTMYESREFSALPILADALQDAGCDSADVLDHCRGPGPHVRGCWVVDFVLAQG